MYQLLSILKQSKVVKDIEIIKFTAEEDIQRVYLCVLIKDGSILYIREIRTAEFENYSYHWQTARGRVLARWDNAAHHKSLDTFPHHMHLDNKIQPSKKPDIRKILEYVKKNLEK